MADIYSVLEQIISEGIPLQLARNPNIQFGAGTRRYLGAQIMPERLVFENQFTEDNIVYRTTIANDGTRYSEPQLKSGADVATFIDVKLGEIDIARQLTGRDFDNIRKIAKDNPDLARSRLIAWINTAVNLALIEKQEIQRWQAIVEAVLQIEGTDGKIAPRQLIDPDGHRITIPSGTQAAPTGWYGAEDPMEAIFHQKTLLNSKGFEISRIIGDSQITSALVNNATMQGRLGTLTINNQGSLETRRGLVDKQALDNYFRSNFGLPAMEEYDLTYRTQIGSGFFKRRGTLVMVATTGRNEDVELPDGQLLTLENTLGYQATGLAVGEDRPGRVIRSETRFLKPVGLYSQGFATTSPVIVHPDAISVISVDLPAAA